jgi:hypothetical protein
LYGFVANTVISDFSAVACTVVWCCRSTRNLNTENVFVIHAEGIKYDVFYRWLYARFDKITDLFGGFLRGVKPNSDTIV